MHIGIYHPFYDLPDNYSLTHVVIEQAKMILEAGHECTMFVSKNFKPDAESKIPDGVMLAKILPNDIWVEIYNMLLKYADGIDVMFTHDVVYLSIYEEHARAIAAIAKMPKSIKWFHWIHSAPNPNEKRAPISNSVYVCVNKLGIPALAKQFGVPEAQCVTVYNPVTPQDFFGFHPFSRYLVNKFNLLDTDILITFPLDIGRWGAKGGPHIEELVRQLRVAGKNAKVVFVDAASNSSERATLVEHQHKPDDGIIYTSAVCEGTEFEYEVSVPREVVRDLMLISNVFPLLSMSEGCSLTMLEAALTKNYVILNNSFFPMVEFGELDYTGYMHVSSATMEVDYKPNKEEYFKLCASAIIEELDSNKALKFNRKVLNRFNRQWIWKNQLEPLLK